MEKKIVGIFPSNTREILWIGIYTWPSCPLGGFLMDEAKLVNGICYTEIRNILPKHELNDTFKKNCNIK